MNVQRAHAVSSSTWLELVGIAVLDKSESSALGTRISSPEIASVGIPYMPVACSDLNAHHDNSGTIQACILFVHVKMAELPWTDAEFVASCQADYQNAARHGGQEAHDSTIRCDE